MTDFLKNCSINKNKTIKLRNLVTITNLKFAKKIIFGPYFFFLLYNPFSFCNLNFELKVYFFNISVLEFERKSSRESYLKSVKKSESNVSP